MSQYNILTQHVINDLMERNSNNNNHDPYTRKGARRRFKRINETRAKQRERPKALTIDDFNYLFGEKQNLEINKIPEKGGISVIIKRDKASKKISDFVKNKTRRKRGGKKQSHKRRKR